MTEQRTLPFHDQCRMDGPRAYQQRLPDWKNRQGCRCPLHERCRCTGEVSSRASPEVTLGAVDLLSLRAAQPWCRNLWSPQPEGPAKACTSELPAKPCTAELFRKLDYPAPCCLPADASASWQSDSSSSRMHTADEDQLLVSCLQHSGATHCQLAPHAPKAATDRGKSKRRANLRPGFNKGRARDPACIKQWAALTTWLRQNLHQARTAKREVCFVGKLSARLGRWVFDLNPNLRWDEVSKETKQRLCTLPREAEQAFTQKHPCRDPSDWQQKAVKYKPGNRNDAYNVLMGHLVYDLHRIYLKYEVHHQQSSA